MSKSITFEWPLNFDFGPFRSAASPRFSIRSNDEIEWFIILTRSREESDDYFDLELRLARDINMKSVSFRYDLHVVESTNHDKILFSKKGKRFLGTASSKTVKLKKVFPRTFLLALEKKFRFSCICHLELDTVIDEPYITCIKQEIPDFEKIMKNPRFSDFTLTTAKRNFEVHRAILMARSPVFAAMFEQDMDENHKKNTRIMDIEDDVLQELLRYMYCGKVKNMDVFACELFKAADKYQIESLKYKCLDTLLRSITIENVAVLYSMANLYSNQELKYTALEFIKSNLKKILENSCLDNYSRELLADIIRFTYVNNL